MYSAQSFQSIPNGCLPAENSSAALMQSKSLGMCIGIWRDIERERWGGVASFVYSTFARPHIYNLHARGGVRNMGHIIRQEITYIRRNII